MSITPIITFKAGICDVDVRLPDLPPDSLHSTLVSPLYTVPYNVANNVHQSSSKPYKVNALPTPGYIYLYSEDGTADPLPSNIFPSVRPRTNRTQT